MKEVDHLFVGPELPEKRPVVGCGIGDHLQVGACFPDMGDFIGKLRLQRCLASLRHPIQRFQASAVSAMETDRPAGRLTPARFLVPVRAKRNHSSETAQETASSGTVSRMVFMAAPSFSRLPAFVNKRLRLLDDGPPNLDFGPVRRRGTGARCEPPDPVLQAQLSSTDDGLPGERKNVTDSVVFDIGSVDRTRPSRRIGPSFSSRSSAHLRSTARPSSISCFPVSKAANASGSSPPGIGNQILMYFLVLQFGTCTHAEAPTWRQSSTPSPHDRTLTGNQPTKVTQRKCLKIGFM